MRTWIAIAAAVAVVVAVPLTVFAFSSTTSDNGVSCQQLVWRTTSTSTSSSSFTNLPGLASSITSIDAMTITVSVVVNGAPVSLRVKDTSITTTFAPPGDVFFTPSSPGTTSFSFTWSDPGIGAAEHGHTIEVQWRTTGPGTATLKRGDIVVLYNKASCPMS